MVQKPVAWISKITFAGGQQLDFEPGEKVVIVGANNSGKSQLLKDIHAYAGQGEISHRVIIKSLEISKKGDSDQLKRFLDKNARMINNTYYYNTCKIPASNLIAWDGNLLTDGLSSFSTELVSARDRLSICDPQKSVGRISESTVPQHLLYHSEALTARISKLFYKAFKKDLIVNYRGGHTIPIHVGTKPNTESGDRVSDAYVRALEEQPLLEDQGDGMKSYAGTLFETLVFKRDITLIDEVEAFLHPPQRRRLAETLVSEIQEQLFVATHSSDILRGFIWSAKGHVRILRLSREGNQTIVTDVPHETVKDLWDIPLLRYSNAFESLFHEQTIICEADGDCRLYNAVADHLTESEKMELIDTVYVSSNGKSQIPIIVVPLRKLGIEPKAIFDIDLLGDKGETLKIIKAFGGRWSDFSELWRQVDGAVKKQHETGWKAMKEKGFTSLECDKDRQAYAELSRRLAKIGIYLVHVGEIERFVSSIKETKNNFVNKVLEDKNLDREELAGLRTFMQNVYNGSDPLPEI